MSCHDNEKEEKNAKENCIHRKKAQDYNWIVYSTKSHDPAVT